jgi:hypothetical protein
MEWILSYQSRPENSVIKDQARNGFISAQAFETVCHEISEALASAQDLSAIIDKELEK